MSDAVTRSLAKDLKSILVSMPPVKNGGIAEWVTEAVRRLRKKSVDDGAYHDEALITAATAILSKELRHARVEMNVGGRAVQGHMFHSLEIENGKDKRGKIKTKRVYKRAIDQVYPSVEATDQVVDYQVGQSKAFAKEANLTVMCARSVNPRYQRALPFPELWHENDDTESPSPVA